MPRNHFCLIVAVRHTDGKRDIRSAATVVRAEHSNTVKRSCIEEELAQGISRPNDWSGGRPSIFNDDEEFAVLTRHDELLLKCYKAGI